MLKDVQRSDPYTVTDMKGDDCTTPDVPSVTESHITQVKEAYGVDSDCSDSALQEWELVQESERHIDESCIASDASTGDVKYNVTVQKPVEVYALGDMKKTAVQSPSKDSATNRQCQSFEQTGGFFLVKFKTNTSGTPQLPTTEETKSPTKLKHVESETEFGKIKRESTTKPVEHVDHELRTDTVVHSKDDDVPGTRLAHSANKSQRPFDERDSIHKPESKIMPGMGFVSHLDIGDVTKVYKSASTSSTVNKQPSLHPEPFHLKTVTSSISGNRGSIPESHIEQAELKKNCSPQQGNQERGT